MEFDVETKWNNFIDSLKLYAHNNDKKCFIEKCPVYCDTHHDLNLDTSIAWELAKLLKRLKNTVIYNFDGSDVRIAKIIFSIDNVVNIVANHKEKYFKFFNLLKEINYFLFELKMCGYF